MSNIIQSSQSGQDLKVVHEYRTLGKVGVIDGLYDSLWTDKSTVSYDGSSNAPATTKSSHQQGLNKDDIKRIDFGNKRIWSEIDNYQSDTSETRGCPGSPAMERVLYALHKKVLGGVVDYAPLIPTLASILLGFMSESYTFYALREMFNHFTWYWAASRPEHVAYERAFCDVLQKLHPGTAGVMKEQEQAQAYCDAIFRDFFTGIWPEPFVLRLMDIYTLEGSKVS
jgi:Rab-GTPase-TBC domain